MVSKMSARVSISCLLGGEKVVQCLWLAKFSQSLGLGPKLCVFAENCLSVRAHYEPSRTIAAEFAAHSPPHTVCGTQSAADCLARPLLRRSASCLPPLPVITIGAIIMVAKAEFVLPLELVCGGAQLCAHQPSGSAPSRPKWGPIAYESRPPDLRRGANERRASSRHAVGPLEASSWRPEGGLEPALHWAIH